MKSKLNNPKPFLFLLILIILSSSVYAEYSCPSGNILSYRAENSSEDSKGNYNAEMVNGAFYSPGYVGKSAFSFDGIDDYLNSSISPQFEKNQSFSISLWVNLAGDGIIISNADCNDALQGYSIASWYGGTTFIGFNSNPGSPDGIGGEGPGIGWGSWTHLVIAYNGSNDYGQLGVYVNGGYIGEFTGQIFGSTLGNGELHIGDQCGTGFTNMQIDQINIYNKKLNDSEVLDLYNSGSGESCPRVSPMFNISLNGINNDVSSPVGSNVTVIAQITRGDNHNATFYRNGVLLGSGTYFELNDTMPMGVWDYKLEYPSNNEYYSGSLTRRSTIYENGVISISNTDIPSSVISVGVIVAIISLVIIFFILAFVLKGGLELLFFVLAFVSFSGLLRIIATMAKDAGMSVGMVNLLESFFIVMMCITMFILAYIFIKLVKYGLSSLEKKRLQKWGIMSDDMKR